MQEQKTFERFAAKVSQQFDNMTKTKAPLYVANLNGEDLWALYLNSIPAEQNPVHHKRPFYDSQYDKQFVCQIGRLVTIHNNQLVSVWDVEDTSFFGNVAKRLSQAVKQAGIAHSFITNNRVFGHKPNKDLHNDNLVWSHFYVAVPKIYLTRGKVTPQKYISDKTSRFDLLKKSFATVDVDTLNRAASLISQTEVHKIEAHLGFLYGWRQYLKGYQDAANKDLYVWEQVNSTVRVFNHLLVGRLVRDLKKGLSEDVALNRFVYDAERLRFKQDWYDQVCY